MCHIATADVRIKFWWLNTFGIPVTVEPLLAKLIVMGGGGIIETIRILIFFPFLAPNE